jgi:hypothetical protein
MKPPEPMEEANNNRAIELGKKKNKIYKSQPLDPQMGQMDKVHSLTPDLI